ncbi:hypothetical protein HMPREF0494_0275 [Limosilactobacillus antri DSM 16041]|uniref:Uncharacterized protein n=1 Tax=Limosilactobacillus antri DSM 16041 TaxID=525309 RepID=C8P4N1_9LACO|nr:hypothetical protein HMPREF0494_0275 [Limosilactobacillus antri DSM 16041]
MSGQTSTTISHCRCPVRYLTGRLAKRGSFHHGRLPTVSE